MIHGLFLRKCDSCNKGMGVGYYADGSYYCTNECLHKAYTPIKWGMLATDDSDEYYWTEWHEWDGEDVLYTADGKVIGLTEYDGGTTDVFVQDEGGVASTFIATFIDDEMYMVVADALDKWAADARSIIATSTKGE